MNVFPNHWSVDQALAVDQVLILLREQLWQQYRPQLQPLFDEHADVDIDIDDPLRNRQLTLFDDNDWPF